MAQTRRQFLAHTGCGALSAAALLSGLGRLALIDALAQSGGPAGYKALVCIFLFGGNDANNVVMPYTNYSDYSAYRVVGTDQFAVPQDQLLQINPPRTPGLTFGLHPKLGDAFGANPSFYTLFTQPQQPQAPPPAAIVCNVGPLIRPISRAEYRAGVAHPYQLFSHSDQQTEMQTGLGTTAPTGWAGRVADKMK